MVKHSTTPGYVGALVTGHIKTPEAEPRATLKLKLTSSTGYVEESTFTGITPEQWGKVCRILHGTDGVDSPDGAKR
jgi:hypothetical protein